VTEVVGIECSFRSPDACGYTWSEQWTFSYDRTESTCMYWSYYVGPVISAQKINMLL